jgi:putative NADH-flavin reductase
VEAKLIPKSKAAREQLARLTKEVAALAHAPNAAAAEKSLNATGAELQDAVQQTSNDEQVANVKFVVSCALPGNPNAEKKVDKALAGLQNLVKIHKALEAEL